MKLFNDTVKHYWGRARDFCVYKVLHADDPPHRLALGIGIGMFVTFMPLIGFQMALSVFIAWLLRANKLVGVPLVWLSNPLTVFPIYYPCYLLGCKLLGAPAVSDDWQRLEANWQQLQATGTVTMWNKVQFWWESTVDMIWPLSLGCMVVGLTAGVLSYYVSLFAIRSYRLRRWGQLMPPSLTPEDSSQGVEVQAALPPVDDAAQGGNAA